MSARGERVCWDTVNINAPDVFYNPALFDALQRTRAGENVELFDQIFMGLAISGTTPVNGTTQRGSEQMRNNTTFRADLANGNFFNLANSLNTYNGTGSAGSVPATVAGETGTVLRRANKGFNVPGGTTIAGGPVIPAGLYPENWIVSNPQFGNDRYWMNSGSSNYHSLQVQTTFKPINGLSVQLTYVFSRRWKLRRQRKRRRSDQRRSGLYESDRTKEGLFMAPNDCEP
jgi:hypothetical protein